jgi:arylsulfatase A-like enzyme
MDRDTGNGMETPTTEPYTSQNWPAPDKGFAAMVTRMDADIGKLFAKLKERGQDQNTLVIFTSDNGPHREGGHDPEFFNDNGPLRGIKRDLYEGGIRVPFLVRWPAALRAGQVSDHVCAFWDFLPTVAQLTGQAAPRDTDGISFLPTLEGGMQARHDYLYWEFHERGFHQAVRMGDWKGVRLGPGKPLEVYDLKTDIGEQSNVAAQQPDIAKRLEAVMGKARTESADWPVKG